MAKTTKPEKAEEAKAPKEPKVNPTRWDDPEASFAPDDESLEAQMWRMSQRQQGKAV